MKNHFCRHEGVEYFEWPLTSQWSDRGFAPEMDSITTCNLDQGSGIEAPPELAKLAIRKRLGFIMTVLTSISARLNFGLPCLRQEVDLEWEDGLRDGMPVYLKR